MKQHIRPYSLPYAFSIMLCFLSGCATEPPGTPSPANIVTPLQRPTGPTCIASLSYQASAFNRIPDFKDKNGCGVETAISLVAVPTATMSRPITIGCELAFALSRYEAVVLQPLAQRFFGSPIVTIDTYGGYACRGRSSNKSRLSEHGRGKAVDLGAFILENGTIISVKKDWHAKGPKSDFLHQAAQAACPYFSVVLTPDSDAAHHDHFHLDIGPWKKCI